MKKLLQTMKAFLVLAMLCVGTNVRAAATFWKVSANTAVTADQTYVSISSLTVVSTSAGTLDSYSYTYSDIGSAVSKSIRVRSAEAPSTTSPSGTDQEGATRLVLTVTSEVNVAFYYRRQADGGASSNCTYTENNGKDLLIVNQDAPTTYLTGTMTKESDCTTSDTYGHVKKAYTLAAGTYTVYALGTTIQLNAIFYDDGRHTETFDFATLGNTYANGTMNDGFKWFTFDGPYTLTDNAVNNKDVTDLYKIENVGNEDKSVIGRYVNGRIAIQKNKGNSGSPWLRNNGNGIQSNGNQITGYLALYGLSAGDDITITGSNWNLCSGNVSASAGGSAVESLTTGTKYYVLNSNPILLYQGTYPQIKKVVINTKTDLLSNLSATSAVSGANRVLTVSPSFSTADDAVMKSYYTTDGTTPTTSSTEVTNNQITISSNSTVKIVGANTKKGSLSNVVSMDVTTGEVTLNNPVIALTGMTGTNGLYVPTYSISEDNSDKEGTPVASLSATFNGLPVDISGGTFEPSVQGTLIVTATCEGYNSSSKEETMKPLYELKHESPNFNEIALANIATTLGVGTWNANAGYGRWANWSRTGGVNADLSTNSSADYYYATVDANFTYDNWLTVTTGNAFQYLAGFGFGSNDKTKKAYCSIAGAVSNSIVAYTYCRNDETSVDYKDGTSSYTIPTSMALKKVIYYEPLPATISATITSAGYATFSSTYALDFTNVDNAKAYIVTGQNATGTSVIMEQVTGTVEAGTGLVLESNNGGEATVTIPIVAEGTSYNTNKLWAITEDDYVSKANDDSYTNYVLSVQDNKVVFASIDEVAAPIKAGQAALSLPKINTAKSLSLSPEQVTTGINTVQGSGVKVNGYYDLQGRRVSQPTKGLYIMDGKKIIIK